MDWAQENCPFHGFARCQNDRAYYLRLTLNMRQESFWSCDSRETAARHYDALLKFFLPFTSSCAVPNFPADFDKLTADSLFQLEESIWSPDRIFGLETELSEQFAAWGKDVETVRTLRADEIKARLSRPDVRAARLHAKRERAFKKFEQAILFLNDTELLRAFLDMGIRNQRVTYADALHRVNELVSDCAALGAKVRVALDACKAALECEL